MGWVVYTADCGVIFSKGNQRCGMRVVMLSLVSLGTGEVQVGAQTWGCADVLDSLVLEVVS